jgi:hypothetical protein
MRDTIDMARESKLDIYGLGCPHDQFMEKVKAFEALVRADQDERYKWDVHSCGPTCKRYACVAMREAVEAEREACAKVCEEYETNNDITATWLNIVAEAIRARSKDEK